MKARALFGACGRSLLSGASLIMALTSCSSAISALRWQRAAEPCVWISNPLGDGAWASFAWNLLLTIWLGVTAMLVLLRESPAGLVISRKAIGILSRTVVFGLLAFALRSAFDVAMFFRLVRSGEIVSSYRLPLSLAVQGVFCADACLVRRTLKREPQIGRLRWQTMLVAVVGMSFGQIGMIALHVLTFGTTDYRREADVVVVLGAKVHPDGTLSLALSDRLDTAAELYHEGRVRFVLVSGATGIEGINEASAMRGYLIKAGLPADRLFVDPQGVNTLATARNTQRLMADNRLKSALVVSHYFHLARCKLLFEEQGIAAFTVPARMSRRLILEPYYFARECVGYLWYALTRPLRPVVRT